MFKRDKTDTGIYDPKPDKRREALKNVFLFIVLFSNIGIFGAGIGSIYSALEQGGGAINKFCEWLVVAVAFAGLLLMFKLILRDQQP